METPNVSSDNAEKSRRSPAEERARKKARMDPLTFSNAETVVKLLIGDAQDPIEKIIHKEVACNGSPVFRAAFCGNFSEGQTQTYKLAHVDQNIATLLIQWLYIRSLVVTQLKDDWVDNNKEAIEEDCNLIDLWILADELGMPALQNTAIRTMYDISEKTQIIINRQTIKRLFHRTPDGSRLRIFISHYVAHSFWPGMYEIQSGKYKYPYEMLAEIADYLAS